MSWLLIHCNIHKTSCRTKYFVSEEEKVNKQPEDTLKAHENYAIIFGDVQETKGEGDARGSILQVVFYSLIDRFKASEGRLKSKISDEVGLP